MVTRDKAASGKLNMLKLFKQIFTERVKYNKSLKSKRNRTNNSARCFLNL